MSPAATVRRALPLVILAACGQSQMVRTSARIRSQMLGNDYRGALATLRAGKHAAYREQDRVVYWMNEGMLLHLIGDYKQSTAVLQQAERRSEELFTTSVRKQVKAAFTSQAATDYQGEDYEKVLLNVVKAFNFLRLGDLSGALVEARKINEKLQYYNTKYQHKNVYNQDAFAHWLMGLLFELERSYDDARIAYTKALEVYQQSFLPNYGLGAPPFLAEDIARVATLNGDTDLLERIHKHHPDSGRTADLLKQNGEVILFNLTGEGPSKSDYFVTCWVRSASSWACDGEPGGEFIRRTRITIPRDATVVKVAFPQLHLHAPASPYLTMRVAGVQTNTQPAYPLNAIAAKTLRDKTHRIFRDAIIRIITKMLAQKAAGAAGKKAGNKDTGWLAESLVSITMQAMEEADKRAWTTLPARIDVGRAIVSPGVHTLELLWPNGRRAKIEGLKVEAGKRVFVTYRTMP